MSFQDPATEYPAQRPYAQPGGCGVQTLTPDFIFRGALVQERLNPQEAYGSG